MQNLGNALADSLAGKAPTKVPTTNPLAVIPRNLLFLVVVLFHGFRRVAPPY